MRLCPVNEHLSRSAIAAVPSIGRAAHVERAARDADTTHDLFERYAGQIFGFCVNKLGSRDEAEDALQSTFLNAHRALQRGVTPEAELAWLYKIAHNVCLTRRRSTRRRGRIESPSDFAAVQDVLPAPSRDSSDDLVRLTEALEHMPESQRRAILLREWQGLSYHEIAEELELSQSAVETLIFRARRTLASNLESETKQPNRFSRMRKALDVGTLLAALKGLFGGSAAVKVAAVAVAASGTAVVATAQPSKPTPQKQAVTSVAHAAPASAPVVFERIRPRLTSAQGSEPKLTTAAAKTPPPSALAAAAAKLEKRTAKDDAKRAAPGQTKKQPPAAQARGSAVKGKKKKSKSPTVHRRQRAPVQSAAPTPEPVAPAVPHAAESNGQGGGGQAEGKVPKK